jgi:hypothetical protein
MCPEQKKTKNKKTKKVLKWVGDFYIFIQILTFFSFSTLLALDRSLFRERRERERYGRDKVEIQADLCVLWEQFREES